MNVNQILDKIHFKPMCWLISAIIWAFLIGGCAVTTKITDPNDQVYTYHGPKDVDYSVKKGDMEIKYSGKTEGFWSGMLRFLLLKAPDINVVK
ncbi:hypothetical protein LCGC14_2002750 [marine sediment metagenome]|uniref:Uncharacterized protein n=1 Tax=marine sediment metagenome TaxID=412755 RepID=A0A0F9F2U9_9ZZZZ